MSTEHLLGSPQASFYAYNKLSEKVYSSQGSEMLISAAEEPKPMTEESGFEPQPTSV